MNITIPSRRTPGLLAAAFMTGALASPLLAGTTETTTAPAMEPAAAQPIVHFLLQLDFSSNYITPRGLNVENEGMVFQPLLLSFWSLYSDKSQFVNDVTLTAGVWASIHTHESGADPGHWNEWDPILGLSYGLGDYVKFETNFTAFDSMVDSYTTSYHMELKLKLDDSKWLGAFALNPYVAYWQELDNKATVVFDSSSSEESFYFTFGIDPGFKAGDVKFDFPTYINLVGNEFYQQFDGSPGGAGLAVFGTGVKASLPLKFIPEKYGFWTAYTAFKYYHLSNDGLLDGNQAIGGGDREDLYQISAGLSIFF
ncbi:MAG: hypothetical protein ABIS50_01370 [Luteolibacter sp.]|uniref:hypothetical protein n=1 Tax=Luteolibacter sp. TaxID=1962973 RepID=UPI0032664A01